MLRSRPPSWPVRLPGKGRQTDHKEKPESSQSIQRETGGPTRWFAQALRKLLWSQPDGLMLTTPAAHELPLPEALLTGAQVPCRAWLQGAAGLVPSSLLSTSRGTQLAPGA